MKKIILPLVAVIALVGCGEKKEQEQTKTTQQTAKPTQEIVVKSQNMEIIDDNPLYDYDIDGNRVLKLAYDGEETQTTKQIAGLITVKNSYDNLSAEILANTMSKNFIVKCSSCHNRYANGVVGPSLLDKSAKEISDMIEAYKEGSEKNILMQYLVSQMDKAEIDALANEIANLNKKVMESKQ
jgi:cytochrome c553